MTPRPPADTDQDALEDADYAEPRTPMLARRASLLRFAGFLALLVVISILAVVVFLGITVGVTILVASVVPKPVNLIAPLIGIAVASLCFGAASRIRKGALRNRYGLFRRPPRDLGQRPADR